MTSTTDDGSVGTLRYAIANASGGDTIQITATGTITLNSQLTVDKNLTINGPGAANLTISGNNASRVFFVQSGTVAINDATIADGYAKGGNGGNAMAGGGGGLGAGGAVFVNTGANVTLNNVALSHNAAVGGNGGNGNTMLLSGGGGGGLGGNGGNGFASGGSGAGGGGGGSVTNGGNATSRYSPGAGGVVGGGNGGADRETGQNGADFGGGGGGGGEADGGNGGFGGGGGGGDYEFGGNGGFGGGGGGGYINGGSGNTGGGNGGGPSGGGGGGAGFGGTVFVREGGSLTVTGATSFSDGSTAGGSGGGGKGAGANGSAVGNALYLNVAGATFNNNTDQTLADTIAGSGGITKLGTGKLTLTGANTYTGGTTVSAGILQGNTGSLPGDIVNNATVVFDQAVDGTYAGKMSGTGSLTKIGASTLILSGANAYTGGTTVSAGILQGNTDSLPGDILNNAAVIFDQAVDGTYAGNMSGTGSLTKMGAGTLILSGTNSHTGGTHIDGGTLQVASDANLGAAGGALAFQGGTLQFSADFTSARNITIGTIANIDTNGHNAVLSGNISGLFPLCSIVKNGEGTLFLSGTNTYDGFAFINAGILEFATPDALPRYDHASLSIADGATVAVATSGWTSEQIDTLLANPSFTTGNLGFDVAASSVFNYGTSIGGGIGLMKLGAGTLTLTGANTYTGPTTVAEGTLCVNGSLSSNVTVNSGARIAGSGAVGGLTVNGTVAPGNSIGTLTVNGNYVQNAGSTYEVEINRTGQSDRIEATGTASLAGSVSVTAESGTYLSGMRFYILHAAEGVSGEFDDLTLTNLPSFHGLLEYDLYDVFLLLLSNRTPYVDLAQTQNQFAVASYMEALEPGATGDLRTVFDAIDAQSPAGARSSFNQLMGEPYADLGAINTAGANLFTDTAFYRMWNIDDFDCRQRCDDTGRKLWAYGIGNWQRQRTTTANAGWDTYSGYNNPTAGFMIGYDKQFDNVLLGFGSGYGHGDATFNLAPASDRNDLFNFSGYGKADFGPLYVAGAAGFTRGWNDVDRRIQIDDLPLRRAGGSVNSNVFGTLVQTGYNIDLGIIRLTPLAGMRYVRNSLGGTTETGADDVNLVVSGYGRNSLSSHLGGKLACLLTKRWRAEAYGQWEHEFADLYNTTMLAFAGNTADSYVVQGVACGRDGARLGFVSIGQVNRHTSVHLNFDALFQGSYTSQQLTGGLSLGF